jgi:hypothetical protein
LKQGSFVFQKPKNFAQQSDRIPSTVTATDRTTSTIIDPAVTSIETYISQTIETTTSTTTVATVTATATAVFTCDPDYIDDAGNVGFGHNCGISNSCFCIPRYSTGTGTCVNGNEVCGRSCDSDSGCDAGASCLKGLGRSCGNGGICVNTLNPICRAQTASRMFRRDLEKRSGLEPVISDVLPKGTLLINGKIVA